MAVFLSAMQRLQNSALFHCNNYNRLINLDIVLPLNNHIYQSASDLVWHFLVCYHIQGIYKHWIWMTLSVELLYMRYVYNNIWLVILKHWWYWCHIMMSLVSCPGTPRFKLRFESCQNLQVHARVYKYTTFPSHERKTVPSWYVCITC